MLIGPKTRHPKERATRSASGCLEWQGQLTKYGYGKTMFRHKTIFVHRKAWILERGDIPAGLFVLHKCDNPKCIDIGHLFLGTAKDNALDRESKGRGGGAKVLKRNTHCRRGHAYMPDNIYWSGSRRYCKACNKMFTARYLRKKRGQTNV